MSAGPPDAGIGARRALDGNGPMDCPAVSRTYHYSGPVAVPRHADRAGLDDGVDQAPGPGLGGAHEEIALERLLDLLDGLVAVTGIDLGHRPPLAEDLLGVDLDVARLPLDAARPGLVQVHLRVGQAHPVAGGAAGQQQGASAGRHTSAE